MVPILFPFCIKLFLLFLRLNLAGIKFWLSGVSRLLPSVLPVEMAIFWLLLWMQLVQGEHVGVWRFSNKESLTNLAFHSVLK